jgi:TonB family protein
MTAGRLPYQDHSKYILGGAFLFSLFLHLLFFTSFPLRLFETSPAIDSTPKERIIRVKNIPTNKDGRIVDLNDEKYVTKDSVETDYLSDKNRKVDKQTRSLNVTRQQNQSMNKPATLDESEKTSKYKLDLSDKTLQKIAEKGGQPILNQSMTSNYLPEISIGSETLLNTKEFAFHTFYIRMKREIEGFWHPDRALSVNQAMHGTYITSVTVVLDEQGYLIQTHIYKSSGIVQLDKEAIDSIEKASPFPNPPKELMSDDKRIRVNWNFIFDRTSLM